MAKKRGLPTEFELRVAEGTTDTPPAADIGDFLDEHIPSSDERAARQPTQPQPAVERPEPPSPEGRELQAPPASQQAAAWSAPEPTNVPAVDANQAGRVDRTSLTPTPPIDGQVLPATVGEGRSPTFARRKRPPRREIGLDGETVQMLDMLRLEGCHQSLETNLKQSELVRAMVHALYQARRYIDYGAIRPRGAFGSPTARALVTTLKEAYARAIAEDAHDRYEGM